MNDKLINDDFDFSEFDIEDEEAGDTTDKDFVYEEDNPFADK